MCRSMLVRFLLQVAKTTERLSALVHAPERSSRRRPTASGSALISLAIRPPPPHNAPQNHSNFSNRGSAHGRGHPGRAEQANANVHVALKLVALHGFCARAFKEQSLNCKPKPFLQTIHLATSRSYATCGTKINLRIRQTNEGGTPRKPCVFTNALRESTTHV